MHRTELLIEIRALIEDQCYGYNLKPPLQGAPPAFGATPAILRGIAAVAGIRGLSDFSSAPLDTQPRPFAPAFELPHDP